MATPIIRGRDKLYKHFQSANHKLWKLYNASNLKSPIQVQTNLKLKFEDSETLLANVIESLEPTGVYILDTFSIVDKGGEQRFIQPDTSICFSLSDSEPMNGAGTGAKSDNIGFKAGIELNDHISVIKENAVLSSQRDYFKKCYEDGLQEILRLKNELNIAESLLDEYEEEDEEEEEGEQQSVSGIPASIEASIAKVIAENGGTILENLMSKGVKNELKIETEEEDNEPQINGVDVQNIPDVYTLTEMLQKYDPKLKEHLYKLLLIAQQKPNTFKTFLNRLEGF